MILSPGVEGLTEKDRLGVVLERPYQKPVAERAPSAGPAGSPPRPCDDRLGMLAARALTDELDVARQLLWGHADPLCEALDDLGRGGCQLGRDEPKEGQRAQLNCQAEPVGYRVGGAEGTHPP